MSPPAGICATTTADARVVRARGLGLDTSEAAEDVRGQDGSSKLDISCSTSAILFPHPESTSTSRTVEVEVSNYSFLAQAAGAGE